MKTGVAASKQCIFTTQWYVQQTKKHMYKALADLGDATSLPRYFFNFGKIMVCASPTENPRSSSARSTLVLAYNEFGYYEHERNFFSERNFSD